MSRRRKREYDISGMKLYGKCKRQGKCICGNCANAPANQIDAVTITKPDGTVEQVESPAINDAEIAQPGWKDTNSSLFAENGIDARTRRRKPYAQQNRKHCPDCNMVLRKDHNCKNWKLAADKRLPDGSLITDKAVPPRVANALPLPISLDNSLPVETSDQDIEAVAEKIINDIANTMPREASHAQISRLERREKQEEFEQAVGRSTASHQDHYETIYQLGIKGDATVFSHFMQYEMKNASWEDMLEVLVIALAQEKDRYFKQITYMLEHNTHPSMRIPNG